MELDRRTRRAVALCAAAAASVALGMVALPAAAQTLTRTQEKVKKDQPMLRKAPAPVIREVWRACTPHQVAVFPNRIHVRCTASIAGVEYFALSTDDATHAARTLNVLTAAHVAGRTLQISYVPGDTSGAAIGCQASDCRLILAAVVE